MGRHLSELGIPASLKAATAISRRDDATFSVTLDPAFSIGAVPNGGYIASIFLAVAEAYLGPRGHPDTIAAHWQFLSRARNGSAVLKVSEAKMGRAMSVLHVTLHQPDEASKSSPTLKASDGDGDGDGVIVVAAYLTNRSMADDVAASSISISLPTGWVEPHRPPPVMDYDVLRRQQRDADWERMYVWLMGRLPSLHNVEFYRRRVRHDQSGMLDLWIRLAVGEAFTAISLGYVADIAVALLPETYRQPMSTRPVPNGMLECNKAFWYPTITMNLDVKRKLPTKGVEWLRLRITSKTIQNGRFDAEVLIFDGDDRLVATSYHVAMIVGAERNYAGRRSAPGLKPKV
ncbi:hypothetical protein DCS_02226 [Drechmeria coniospora]|uniref:Thioesterase family protein n=1 Tax=Drechmeria coniospora TaxID=98403 RepID=A0A151GVF3_DRECN|nr:hypothetical protein DCS_02226 [Drechmeria coniospora]KYK61085.1 hypothetical protein DCS_02226 [Drechmeria coniospora]